MPQLDRTFDVFASLEEASAEAERLILELIREAVSSRGSFSVALRAARLPLRSIEISLSHRLHRYSLGGCAVVLRGRALRAARQSSE